MKTKEKILEGIDYRLKNLQKQMSMAYDNDLNGIVLDCDSRIDELETLKEYIENMTS